MCFGIWLHIERYTEIKSTNMKQKIKKQRGTNKGVALIGVLLVIIVVTVFLAAYATRVIYDQKNLVRQQNTEKAEALALAGLARAKQDLFLDSGTWTDGNINGNAVTLPDSSHATDPHVLYSETPLGEGSYIVQLQYLTNQKGVTSCSGSCYFYDKLIRVRSTGYVPSAANPNQNRTLEELVSWSSVMNLGRRILYYRAQPAVDESTYPTPSNETIGITDTMLGENVTISSDENIKGCYDPTFSYRNCMNYHTHIKGSVIISGSADVEMGGMTIE
jgi:type II secretory pathway pseudopilin PulG